MSDFLRNVLRRGAGLAPVLSPRPPDLTAEAEVSTAGEEPAAEAPVPMPAETPRRPAEPALLGPPTPLPTLLPPLPAFLPQARIEEAMAPPPAPRLVVPPEVRASVAAEPSAVPLVVAAAPAPPVIAAGAPPAPPEDVAARITPEPDAPAMVSEVRWQETSEAVPVQPVVEMLPAPPVIGLVVPAPTPPSFTGEAENARQQEPPSGEGERRVQVTIGRIEIRQTAPPPPRQPRGFEDLAAARRYLDRQWY